MVSTLDIRINMNIRTRYSRVRYDKYILGYIWILELDTVELDMVYRY